MSDRCECHMEMGEEKCDWCRVTAALDASRAEVARLLARCAQLEAAVADLDCTCYLKHEASCPKAALAATDSSALARLEARVLREAADAMGAALPDPGPNLNYEHLRERAREHLRALAAERERGGGK